MRAWILEEQAPVEEYPLRLAEMPSPRAQEGEIRLKVLVCGVCRTDIHIAEGDLPLKKSPVILGHEAVGVIDEVGKNAQRFRIGDMVGVFGCTVPVVNVSTVSPKERTTARDSKPQGGTWMAASQSTSPYQSEMPFR